MQHNFCSSSQFLQRTDALASVLACNLNDLPEKLGISERSLYGYRAGKYTVTAKALRKLEAAERKVGITQAPPGNAEPLENPKQSGIGEITSSLSDEVAPYRVTKKAGLPESEIEKKEPTMAEAFQKLGEALDMLKHLMENMPKDPKL